MLEGAGAGGNDEIARIGRPGYVDTRRARIDGESRGRICSAPTQIGRKEHLRSPRLGIDWIQLGNESIRWYGTRGLCTCNRGCDGRWRRRVKTRFVGIQNGKVARRQATATVRAFTAVKEIGCAAEVNISRCIDGYATACGKRPVTSAKVCGIWNAT